jgi:acyl carrier protein|tara:strand:+ start:1466 stop:1720 length:255 start_codon:yes stop_codon:yes gene_type:complete
MYRFTEEEVLKIIEEAIELEKGTININSNPNNVSEWDSLGHLNILMSLDKRLDGKASGLSELAKAMSVKKIISVLKNNNFYFNK